MFGHRKKIKIVCIVQSKAIINKTKRVFKELEKDQIFDTKILAFPEDINEFPKNKDLSFWKEQFGDLVINPIVDNNSWYDLKKDKPDYIIVTRPYDLYLPKEYYLIEMSKYSRIIYIPYGYALADFSDITMSEAIMRELSIIVSEHTEETKYYQSLIDKINDGKERIVLDIGYPAFDDVIEIANREESVYKGIDKKNSINIMYTPRWISDKKIGGTTFFKYKDLIVDYIKYKKDMQLLFRPHPLAFKNFLSTKEMTKKEVDDYLNNFKNSNMVYDNTETYLESFKDTDVLITDFSSIIPEFMFFNKPIIFLQRDLEILNETMKDFCKAFYCCKNFSEIKKTLDDLKKGKDPLKKEREKKIKKLKELNDGTVCKRLVEFIKSEYKSGKNR